MALLLEDAEILVLGNDYEMGDVWNSSTDGDKLLSVNTVEGEWLGLPWKISPFTDSDTADRLRYYLALSARVALESTGSPHEHTPVSYTHLTLPTNREV